MSGSIYAKKIDICGELQVVFIDFHLFINFYIRLYPYPQPRQAWLTGYGLPS